MGKSRSTTRARFRSGVATVSMVALLVPGTGVAARPNVDSEAPAPVSVLTREQLENLPVNRDLRSILDLHNRVRAEVKAPPLRWNPTLAEHAQDYANDLADTGTRQHSSRVGRENERENIVVGPLSGISPLNTIQIWVSERQFFRPGTFPNVSSTGDWSKIGHYSQMIWPTTTDVGCGYASRQYYALVCRYSPPGNRDGDRVGFPPINIALGGPPVININNPAVAPPQPARPGVCQVAEPDDLVDLINRAAAQSGLARDSVDPRDAAVERQWQLALDREQDVQDRLMKELATVQGDVAKNINAYLAATSTFQERYVYISSSTTGLQGLLTNWYEARGVYEKADLAFALMNLGVGVGKLGFKAYKFLAARRAAAAAETTQVAASGARAGEAVAAGGARTGEAVAATAGETQVFNRTLIPPGRTGPSGRAMPGRGEAGLNLGANPNVPGMAGYKGVSAASGKVAEAGAAYARAVAEAQQAVAKAKAAGQTFVAELAQAKLDTLIKQGAAGYEAAQTARLASLVAEVDAGAVKLAREAGVDVEKVLGGAAAGADKEWVLLQAIAQARKWHDVPKWAGDPITNILINARKVLAGVSDAKINPKDLELLRSLKAYVEGRGMNFAQYLRTAAGETSVGGEVVTEVAGIKVVKYVETLEGIVRYYDDVDIDLLLKALDAGGDATQLRNAVSPVTQASLNGLARAGVAAPGATGGAGQLGQGACGTLGGNVSLTRTGGAGPGAAAPGGRPTDAQMANVMTGLGELGQVGLGNVVDQFGVTDRFTAGQGLPRAMAGELWEFVTSPSATTASFYYTWDAQNHYLNLLQNEQSKLIELGTSLDAASRSLADLQTTLQRAGLNGPGSYLGTRGPADLRRALDELQKVHNSGSDDWKRKHRDQMDQRRAHIMQKLEDLGETVADLNGLAAKMGLVRSWLDSLRRNPDGSARGPINVFNPLTFVRLGSISLYLRGMGADVFGLTTDVPFRVSAAPPKTEAELEQIRKNSAINEAYTREQARSFDEAGNAPQVADPSYGEWLKSLDGG